MHRSRLAGLSIDCQTEDLDQAASFWSQALGLPIRRSSDPAEANYIALANDQRDLHVEVQKVDHPSRVHLDIEADDVEAEVARLERLGATRVAKVRSWWVMAAPTGQRFCVIRQQGPGLASHGNQWADGAVAAAGGGGIAARLAALGLLLPPPVKVPDGVVLPFPWVNIQGNRAFVSGHGPQEADGAIAGPFGQVGGAVSVADACQLARKTALGMLASLQRALGDLDRIQAFGRVFGMVNSAPGFGQQPVVINSFSELILTVFGPEVGRHARSAIGVAALPFNMAVEVEAELLLKP